MPEYLIYNVQLPGLDEYDIIVRGPELDAVPQRAHDGSMLVEPTGDKRIAVDYASCQYPGCPLWIEFYDTGQGCFIVMGGLEHTHTLEDVRRADYAALVLRGLTTKPGRPAGERLNHATDADFLADLDTAIVQVQHDTGHPIVPVGKVLWQLQHKATVRSGKTYVRDRLKATQHVTLNQYLHRHAARLWARGHPN